MQYNQFQDLQLSALGLGCMRFPTVDNDYGKVDMEKSERLVDLAMKSGINYYDTAWFYHEGTSESVMGQLLSKYPRSSYYLASKYPGVEYEKEAGDKRLFQRQLERCQVDYFDFYLFHNVWEKNVETYLDPKEEIGSYILRQKEEGKIRHLGFSTHGSLETMKRFLDKYAEHLEFCQIQLNWLDWELQNAKEKVKLIDSYGLPVWVMEPIRGGRLAQLPQDLMAPLKALHPDWTAPEWALRFLQSIPQVKMVLSGMSNETQLGENIATYSQIRGLNEEEMQTLLDLGKRMNFSNTLNCTGCRYCADRCPQELDIPKIVQQYNAGIFTGKVDLEGFAPDKTPDNCVGCGSCEAVCPQKIRICQMMEKLK